MLDPLECERARVSRNRVYDRRYFTGVRTTGVDCRPVCPVRPARGCNVEFFPSAAAAEVAGYRVIRRTRCRRLWLQVRVLPGPAAKDPSGRDRFWAARFRIFGLRPAGFGLQLPLAGRRGA